MLPDAYDCVDLRRLFYIATLVRAYGKAGIRNPESGAGAGNGTGIETRVNWEALKPVPYTRVEIKFKMASSVIIVLRNFQNSDRDTNDIFTARKSLRLVI